MNTLAWIIGATVVDGLMALVGALTLWMSERSFKRVIFSLVAFSAGSLFAGALVHLQAEALELLDAQLAFLILIAGFSVFFVLERFLWWHHCHEGECDVHPASYLILLGDGIHNFIDGAVIGASFLVSIPFGVFTTIMVLLHELPQELGDFAILVHGGISRLRALAFNLAAQLTCVAGGIAAYAFRFSDQYLTYLLPFAAGGFIYISASDLIPELHREADRRKSLASFALFGAGVITMVLLKRVAG